LQKRAVRRVFLLLHIPALTCLFYKAKTNLPGIMPIFKQQLCTWLETLDFECKVKTAGDFSFTILILKEECILMEILLIESGKWQKSGTFENLLSAVETVKLSRENGVRSIIIWDDFWISKTEIIKSRISAALGISQKIPGRLTVVRRIDKATAAAFIDKNHLNGDVTSKYRYGLFLPERYFRVLNADFINGTKVQELLVAVATFSRPRIFKREDQPFRSYELIRFASLLNSNVVGGLDKLLHAFSRERNPDDIMTYADLEWSDGANYEKLGFQKISIIPPIPFSLNPESMRRNSISIDTKGENNVAGNEVVVYNAGSIKYVKTFSS
jgi:hypothetical protein